MNAAVQLAEVARIAADLDALCGDDEALFADMIEGETDIYVIMARLHSRIATDQELLTGIAERQAELAERKRRISDRIAASKATAGKFLRAARLPKIELPEATYSVRDGKPALAIVNADAVPDDLCRFKREPDKTWINEAFAAADDLPNWLTREPARDVVSVRTK